VIEQDFLNYSADTLLELAGRIEDCLGRLSNEQIWLRHSENENAVGNLVLHLCGNVNQWIGSGIGGKPDTRERHKEFEAREGSLGTRLKDTIAEAAKIIRSVPAARLAERLKIQGYDTTGLKAIYHVVDHFAGHTAQIIFATKLLTGQDLGYYAHLNKPKQAEATR
jgi:uncharacterized damage-inducible protein DinB